MDRTRWWLFRQWNDIISMSKTGHYPSTLFTRLAQKISVVTKIRSWQAEPDGFSTRPLARSFFSGLNPNQPGGKSIRR